MRSSLLFACCAAPFVLAGCSPSGPEDEIIRETSVLEYHDELPKVTVPEEVRAGEFFTVTILTHSLTSCTTKGETTLSVHGRTADLHPFDLTRSGEGVACAEVVTLLRHEPSLMFELAGTATVNVHGRRMPGGQFITVTRTVTVRG